MLVKLGNEVRDYAWGSHTLIADRLAISSTDGPMAEIWFGTHPRSEAWVEPSRQSLSQLLGRDLRFMMKFLAADFPLSIQLHPNEQQAIAGFEAENAMNIEIDDDARTFRDHHAKREAIVAITDFDLLVGFAPVEVIEQRLNRLISMVGAASTSLLKRYVALLQGQDGHRALVGDILAGDHPSEIQLGLLGEIAALPDLVDSDADGIFALLSDLATQFGSDRGLLLALTMKRFKLNAGEALMVETGVPHCYLHGLGIEIMTSSDNVLRGGLTAKHVSPADFMAMLDISASLESEPIDSTLLLRGLERYDLTAPDFTLHRVDVSSQNLLVDFGLPGESLLLCIDGELAVSNSLDERLVLRRGEAAYLSADANFYSISGSGAGYLGSAVTTY